MITEDSPSPLFRQPMSRRQFVAGAAVTAGALTLGGVSPALAHDPARHHITVKSLGSETATDWIRTLYDVVMAEGLSPPAAARFYYYNALTMYETANPGMPGYASLAGQVPGLRRLPSAPRFIDWPVTIAAATSAVALGLLPTASEASVTKINAHYDAVRARQLEEIDDRELRRSVRHGERVAARLLDWMASDGYDEASTLPYTPPQGPDMWRSTPPNFGTAIEPHWSLVRPAILRTAGEVEPVAPIPFSAEPGSPFHQEALATYDQSFVNTEEQKDIARFWTDNPRLSGLPSGHWFLLVAQLADAELDLDLGDTVDAFVRLGVALHDAFLCCWTWKYRYNLIRPVSYVQDYIDPSWSTLVNTPQFPEYTSGHSVSSGAAEVVLTSLLGSFPFTDSTGVARGLAPRQFVSFTDAANEAAQSRLYGGIHYPMGIENGLLQGREIGRLVNERLRTKRRRR